MKVYLEIAAIELTDTPESTFTRKALFECARWYADEDFSDKELDIALQGCKDIITGTKDALRLV